MILRLIVLFLLAVPFLAQPLQKERETYENYIQQVMKFSEQKDEKTEDYFARIFKQYKGEKDDKYVERIDTIFSVFPTLRSKDNTEGWNLPEKYYRIKYGRSQKESDDQYYARILRKEKNEMFDAYIKRLDCIFKAYPKLEIWTQIKFDSDSRNFFFYLRVTYKSAMKPSKNIRESITKMYSRTDDEKNDDLSYFKRITARSSGENDEDYVDRLTRIRAKFRNLPLWYSTKYLDLIKNYYKLLYAKKENEKLNDYYIRLTAKCSTEDSTTYVKKIIILQIVFKDLPIWNDCDYLQFTARYYNLVFAKKADEDDKSYLKRVTAQKPSESLETYSKRLDICRWVNRGNNLFYNKENWAYVKNYFENHYKQGKDDVESWLKRVFKRDFQETDEQYVKKLDFVTSMQESLGKVDITETLLTYVSDYYRLLYKQRPNEDKEAWLKRITKKHAIESDVTFHTRLRYLKTIYTECKNYVVGVLKKLVESGKALVKKSVGVFKMLMKKIGKKSTEEEEKKKSIEDHIEEIFGKKSNEDQISWFKRLTKKYSGESTEDYIKCMDVIRKHFPSLELWYNKKYLHLVKEYYIALYKKKEAETELQYYQRIVFKEHWESMELTVQRTVIVRELFPNLPLWTDEKYCDTIKKVYEVEYKIKLGESTQEYVQRVLAKNEAVDTSTEVWAKRIYLIHLSTVSSSIWYEEQYYSFTKSYFKAFYKKREGESSEACLIRALKLLPGEDVDKAIKRISLIKKATINEYDFWTAFIFKKVESSRCLSEEYLEDLESEFFDSATTDERIGSSSKSSSSSDSNTSKPKSHSGSSTSKSNSPSNSNKSKANPHSGSISKSKPPSSSSKPKLNKHSSSKSKSKSHSSSSTSKSHSSSSSTSSSSSSSSEES